MKGFLRGLQWFSLALGTAVAVLLLAVVTGWLWLISPPGERFLAREHRIGPLPNGLTVEVAGFRWTRLGDLRLAALTLRDPEGVFLTASELELAWQPGALWQSQLRIDRLSAADLRLARPPQLSAAAPAGSPGAASTPTGSPGSGAAGLPDTLPLGLSLAEASVDRLALGPALAGRERAWRVRGNLRLNAAFTAITTSVTAAPVAGDAGEGRLRLTINPKRPHANGRVAWDEPGQGPLAHLLELPGSDPVSVEIEGSGWLDAANAELSVAAGEAGNAEATARIQAGEAGDYRLNLSLEARAFPALANRLPAGLADGLAPLLDGPLTASAEARLARDFKAVRAQDVSVSLPGGEVTAAGTYRVPANRLVAQVDAEAAASQRYTALLPGVAWQDLAAELEIAGPVTAPDLDLSVAAREPAWGDWAAASLSGNLQARPLAGPAGASGLPPVLLDGSLTADAPAAPVPALAPLLGERLAVELQGGRVGGDRQRLSLNRARAESGAVSLVADQASYNLGARTGEAALTARLGDLGALRPLLPAGARAQLEPAGTAEVTAQLELSESTAIFSSEGRLTDARLGQPGLDRVVQDGATLRADGAVDAQGLSLTEARLDLPAVATSLRLTGDMGFAPGDAVEARAELTAADLAALRSAAGALPALADADLPELDGAASVTGEVTGTAAAPSVTVTARADSLAIDGIALDRASATASLAPPLAEPTGRLSAAVVHRGQAYAAEGDWRFATDAARLTFPVFALAGLGASLDGALTVDFATGGPPAVSGDLSGRIPRFERLGQAVPALAGLAGEGRADLVLSHDAQGQAAELDLAVREVRFAPPNGTPIAASELALRLNLENLYGLPEGTAAFALDNVVRDQLELSTLDGRVDVGGGAWDVRMTAEGRAGRAFSVSSRATLQPFDQGLDARLHRFSGRYGDEAFELAEPAQATFRRGDIEIPGIRIVGDAGAIELSLNADPDGLAGELSLDALPLGLVRLVEPDLPLQGKVSGEVGLSGTLAEPQGRLDLRVTGLSLDRPAFVGVPPVQVRVRAELAEGRGRATALAYMPRAGAVKVTAETAVPLDPETLAPQLRADQPLTVRTDGELHLAALNDFTADRGIRASGDLALALRLEGELARPGLAGQAELTAGAVEMRGAGVQIAEISGRLVGDGERLRLAGASGRSPNGGRLTFAGGAAVMGPDALSGEIRIRSEEANLVARDDLNAVLNSDVSVKFGPGGVEMGGRVDVVRANYRIPGDLPSEVVALDVTEIPARAAPRPVPPTPSARPANGAAVPLRPPLAGKAQRDGAAEPDRAAPPAVALDLRIVANRRVFVRGRGLDLEMRSDLAIAGKLPDLAVRGELAVVRGTMDLLGQRFTFREGQVTFAGGAANDPELNLVATTRAQRLDVTLRITGTASQPEIELESQPAQPQEEILARLLFGRSVEELSAFEAVALANSTAALTGGGVGVLENLRQGLGVDRLTVRGESSGGSGEGDDVPTVGVGRYFGDNIFVDVEQQLDASQDTQVSVEVSLTRNIRLQTRVNQRAASRLGLNVEWDY